MNIFVCIADHCVFMRVCAMTCTAKGHNLPRCAGAEVRMRDHSITDITPVSSACGVLYYTRSNAPMDVNFLIR